MMNPRKRSVSSAALYSSRRSNKRKPNSTTRDQSFPPESKRSKHNQREEEIDFRDDDDYYEDDSSEDEGNRDGEENGREAEVEETADEKRLRVAKAYLEKVKAITRREQEEEEEEGEGLERDNEKKAAEELRGARDSLVADFLQQEQLEESGRLRKSLASRVLKPEVCSQFRILAKHRQTVTAVTLSEDDSRGFSASKDGSILHWNVESGKVEKFIWPANEVLISHGAKSLGNPSANWCKHILALAVSSDGRYLATGGLDRHIHLWDTRNREHIQAFPGHRRPVSCLAFRLGTSQLMSGSFDRSIKIWNVDDRSYMGTSHGHEDEILAIDCLRKERTLTVGRDRTMRLSKIPEETHLIFRSSTAHLESCCFVSNNEFLSGSDDGSIELWNILKKKPIFVVKDAHTVLSSQVDGNDDAHKLCTDNGLPNGHGCTSACSWVGAVTVCRGSDLAASGAGNGIVRLWSVEDGKRVICPLHSLPLDGFVNSLAFAKSGRFLFAGVGQEPRLGRWGRNTAARNGVYVQEIKFAES